MRAAVQQQAGVRLRDVHRDATVSLDLAEPYPIDRPIVRPRGGRSVETIAVHTIVAVYADTPSDTAYDMGGFLLRADGSTSSATRWIRGAPLDDVPEPVQAWAARASQALRTFAADVDVLAIRATRQEQP